MVHIAQEPHTSLVKVKDKSASGTLQMCAPNRPTVQSTVIVSYSMENIELIIPDLFEPAHEKVCLMSYANNKGADQPA